MCIFNTCEKFLKLTYWSWIKIHEIIFVNEFSIYIAPIKHRNVLEPSHNNMSAETRSENCNNHTHTRIAERYIGRRGWLREVNRSIGGRQKCDDDDDYDDEGMWKRSSERFLIVSRRARLLFWRLCLVNGWLCFTLSPLSLPLFASLLTPHPHTRCLSLGSEALFPPSIVTLCDLCSIGDCGSFYLFLHSLSSSQNLLIDPCRISQLRATACFGKYFFFSSDNQL